MQGNVLFTSIGNKTPLLIWAQKHLKGKIYGSDYDDQCVARFVVQDFIQQHSSWNFESFIALCKSKQIRYVFPTRDGELTFFSHHKKALQSANIFVMISDEDVIEKCNNKWLFYQTVKTLNSDWAIPTYRENLPNDAKWVAKPLCGAGGREMRINISRQEAASLTKHDGYIFQPYIEGQEYSVDLYRNRMGKIIGTIVRERTRIRDGESQITKIVSLPILKEASEQLSQHFNLYGHHLFQWIYDGTRYYVLECNPRVGGASTLSFTCGLDSLQYFIAESDNNPLPNIQLKNTPNLLVRYKTDHFINSNL